MILKGVLRFRFWGEVNINFGEFIVFVNEVIFFFRREIYGWEVRRVFVLLVLCV